MLRLLTNNDLPSMVAIEATAQHDPWNETLFKQCLELGAYGWVIDVDGQLLGFIMLLKQTDEVHILNFCVLKAAQGRGLGKALLAHALADSVEKKHSMMYLEVRQSNQKAISLYERLGFEHIGVRHGYYTDADRREDALVFAKKLTGG